MDSDHMPQLLGSFQEIDFYLQAMGVDIWLPKSVANDLNRHLQMVRTEERASSSPTLTSMLPTTKQNIHSTAAQIAHSAAAVVQSVDSRKHDQVAAQVSSEAIKFSLLLQPVSEKLLLLCELEDPDAPGPSGREAKLLHGILQAISGLRDGQPLYISSNLFRWPVASMMRSNPLFTDSLFAYKALEGLLHAQISQGVSQIIILSDHIKCNEFNLSNATLHQYASLISMLEGNKVAKGAFWKKLQEVLS